MAHRTISMGRTFVHPAFDALVIGGGLSLLAAAWIAVDGTSAGLIMAGSLPLFLLFVNNAHFAASTVRLYRKPDAFRDLPFLTMAFPLVTLVVLTAAIALGRAAGARYWTAYAFDVRPGVSVDVDWNGARNSATCMTTQPTMA